MFVATWLGPVIAIVIAVMKGRNTQGIHADWFGFLLYFTFFLCLTIKFTPQFDESARSFSGGLAYFVLGAILIRR